MRSYHRDKLSSLIQEELGKIIIKNIEFPLGSLVTISEVTLSRDLLQATIWVSVIPSESSEIVLKILDKSRGFLQHELNQRLKIKFTPRISFNIDRGLEHAAKIEKLSLGESDSP